MKPAAPADPDRTMMLPGGAGETAEALAPGARMGEFEVTGVIGQGGFGIVYLAYDHSLDRKVALKEFMPSDLARRTEGGAITVKSERYAETFGIALRSFVNEARLLARFDHPSLVKVYRFWEANSTAYMVMPFYEGATLKETLHRLVGSPDEEWLMALLAPVLNALEVIHAHHCYHRDIAPDNILMLRDGTPVLLDFGAARRVIGGAAQALTVILKPGYAPVEQYADSPGLEQGAWTDLYALASVVHYAIMGRPPTPAPGRMISDPQVPLVQAAAGRYSEAFLGGIDAALRVQPRDRPQNVAHFRDLLGIGALQGHEAPRDYGGRPGEPGSRPGRAGAGPAAPDRRAAPRATDRRAEPRTPPAETASPVDASLGYAQLEKLLAGHIGPLARIILARARKSARTHDELLRTLAAAIDDDEHRASFLSAAAAATKPGEV
jgi:serine/threonine protein kinase